MAKANADLGTAGSWAIGFDDKVSNLALGGHASLSDEQQLSYPCPQSSGFCSCADFRRRPFVAPYRAAKFYSEHLSKGSSAFSGTMAGTAIRRSTWSGVMRGCADYARTREIVREFITRNNAARAGGGEFAPESRQCA
jgi:hypothetical protein